MTEKTTEKTYFTRFKQMVTQIPLPEKFTFPFYYEPHELSRIAVSELQERLENDNFNHNFGLNSDSESTPSGKMFGVLVVQNPQGELGYLSAFSGKVGNSNDHDGFVPPVFDMLQTGDFFMEGMDEISRLTDQIEALKKNPESVELRTQVVKLKSQAKEEIEAFRERMRQLKRERKEKRSTLSPDMNLTERAIIENTLIRESLTKKHELKMLNAEWERKIQIAEVQNNTHLEILKALKKQRKEMSGILQSRLFDAYNFLNAKGELKNLGHIFKDHSNSEPPSGAGECAAPKLLHYAYQKNLKPIAMAEFWWGVSPKSEVRKHGNFYPSCRGKCEPILGFMLEGLQVDSNPMLELPEYVRPLDIVYEDDVLLVINKPAEFLSVPGKSLLPSIYDLVKEKYPEATGPLIVHRLDMATSGILLLTKTKEANKKMQAQFIEKRIRKRYVALLDGVLDGREGVIDLPLRLDVDDRPRQLVCHEHGKVAKTRWEVIDELYGRTRVYFYPITGRTHQLRVHAAHKDGLNTAILGDDLYGKGGKRLHLHAEQLTFEHPTNHQEQTITIPVPF